MILGLPFFRGSHSDFVVSYCCVIVLVDDVVDVVVGDDVLVLLL